MTTTEFRWRLNTFSDFLRNLLTLPKSGAHPFTCRNVWWEGVQQQYHVKVMRLDSGLSSEKEFVRFSRKSVINAVVAALIYLLLIYLFVDYRSDHFLLLAICLLAYFIHPFSRKAFIGFSIFILGWIIYDSLRVVHNYDVNTVHIKDLYEAERSMFGINYQNKVLTPNEYFAISHSSFFDFLSGLFYLNWLSVPLAFAMWTLYKKRLNLFVHFSYAFVLTNIIGFIIYYLYPAAPPWYVQQFGFEFIPGASASSGGLARFDELLNITIFGNIYKMNSNVFAAMPSLHTAYPILLCYYGAKLKNAILNIFLFIFLAGVWFSAVYTSHHYIFDVMGGAFCAIIGILGFEMLATTPLFKKLNEWLKTQLQWYDSVI